MNPKPPVMAIYGGTFDPFHVGHQAICEAILAQTEVDQLRLIPCSLPALKADAHASAFQRLAMLQAWHSTLALEAQQRIVIDDIELKRQGASYTVDTLASLARDFPEHHLLFVLGLDAWQSLSRWHQSERLKQQVNFWVFSRKGEANEAANNGLALSSAWAELCYKKRGYYWLDTSVQIEVSSSAVRNKIQSSQQWLPVPIAQYIKDRSLYTAAESK